jgi:UDP-galactopyranose mutase
MAKYDFLIVGSGLFGSVFARQTADRGSNVLVIEKRAHIGGNCFTETIEDIAVHRYGPHVFHTSEKKVWQYVNRFIDFFPFVNRPKVFYKGKIYSFPINLMTFHQLWGVTTPQRAKEKLDSQIKHIDNPDNLEDWCLSQVGKEVYEIFIKGYTKKQWNKDPRTLPLSIIKRIPIRFNFDDNYYNDRFQAIPAGGYTRLFEKLLEGIDINLNTDFFTDRNYWSSMAEKIVFTGKIDEFFDYRFGRLEYRSLRFESEILDGDFQGTAVINYTDEDVPFTRIIEHKFFEYKNQPRTVITREYPQDCNEDKIPYYPVNDARNNELYQKYKKLADRQHKVIFGGRLGTYSYLDMDDTVLAALQTAERQK